MWVLGLFWWKEQGATFDEAFAAMEKVDEMQDFLDWMDKIGTSWRGPGGRGETVPQKDVTHTGRR
jgi:hypothetical protein